MSAKCTLKDSIDCPICGCIAEIQSCNMSGFSNNPKLSFYYKTLYYECDCGESFTTNESDTISLDNHLRAKNIELRKYKINEYFR